MSKKATMPSLLILAVAASLSLGACQNDTSKSSSPQTTEKMAAHNIYDYKVEGLTGDTIDFAQYKGKKILVVNTASKCGFTPQYEGLEALSKKYGDKLVIVGFPANNFGQQEPGSATDIAEFCKKNYGVSFPMASKISVKGADMAPIYKFLTQKEENGKETTEVKWNFQKYLIDANGNLQEVFYSKTEPMSPELTAAIEQ